MFGKKKSNKKLIGAVDKNQLPQVKELLSQGVLPDIVANDGWSILHIAVMRNNPEIVEELLKAGADVNQCTNKDKATPLYVAAKRGYLAVVEPLLAVPQIQVNQKNKTGATPLYIAAEGGHFSVVDSLLKSHALVDEPNDMGATPLYVAAYKNHIPVSECLLQAKADVNRSNTNKATPLFIASQQGHFEMVQLLCSHHADIDIQSRFSETRTAVEIAEKKEHTDIVKFLNHLQQPKTEKTIMPLPQPVTEKPTQEPELEEKSWYFDKSVKPDPHTTQGCQLIDAQESDIQKVVDAYQRKPVQNMDIKGVQIVYHPNINRGFAIRLELLQERTKSTAFTPRLDQEDEPEWRRSINQKLNEIASPYTDPDCPDVKLLSLWHGTRTEILESMFKTGYASLATTDEGYFGQGIYSTYEAEYAYDVYSRGALLINWVSMYSAYPVIRTDMKKLIGKGSHKNYDAHFIPVVPATSCNKTNSYFPCASKDDPATYHEVVVFESAQCLPRYLVELQPSLAKNPMAFFGTGTTDSEKGKEEKEEKEKKEVKVEEEREKLTV